MKNVYLIFLVCLLGGEINAQNFSSSVSQISLYAQPSIFTFEGYIYLNNHTFGDLNMQFENIEQSVPNGWQTSNCLGANCLPIGVTSGNFTLPVLSNENFVIGHFYPNNVPGSGYMKIKLFEVFNPSDTIVLTYYGVAGTVSGVDKLVEADVQVFPIPASDIINVLLPNDDGKEIRIDIVDMLGRLMKSEIFNQSSNHYDISDLPKGVYFVITGLVKKKFVKQ